MRVVARKVAWDQCPTILAPYTKESQTFLTVGQPYEVHAMAVFAGHPILQIIDDLRRPSWRASWLFDIIDSTVPDDWICNILHEEPSLLLGPEFVARSEEAYGSMVELEANEVDLFWKRVDAMRPERDGP